MTFRDMTALWLAWQISLYDRCEKDTGLGCGANKTKS